MTPSDPHDRDTPERTLFSELRGRKVFQAAAIYGAVAWGITEITVTVVEQLFLPQWVATLAVIGFVVGFPIAMFLAWTFDITAEGIVRTKVGSRRGAVSIGLSLLLLVAGTAGLFLLIKPSLESAPSAAGERAVLPNTIAVMPFDSVGDDSEESYLSEGLGDELRDQLNRVSGLRIAARSSSIAAVEQGLDAITAANLLGVAHIVEGSLRRNRGQLRVSVQLIEGETGLTLWSDTFERSANELLMVQQAIAEEVIRQVLPEERLEPTAPATRDPEANELMLLARHYEQQVYDRQNVDFDTLLRAIDLYRQATEADPSSALAFSRLAGALLYLGEYDAAEAPIFKALTLNPELSEVQTTLGRWYWGRGQTEAGTAFDRAVELNPNNPDALIDLANWLWLSAAYADNERYLEIEDLIRRAVDLDPLSIRRHAALGEYAGKMGLYDIVDEVIVNVETLFDSAEAFRLLGWLNELVGRIDQAIAWTLRARDLEPDDPDHVEKLANLYAMIGMPDTALQLSPEPGVGLLFRLRRYDPLIDIAEELMIDQPDDMNVRYLLAFAYTANGRHESAIHVIRSTGIMEGVVQGFVRTVAEIEAYYTLINALNALGDEESVATARSLAERGEDIGFYGGEIGWVSLWRSCGLAVLERHEEALAQLAEITKARRLPWQPLLQDSHCLRQYAGEPVYENALAEFEARRAAMRDRLPGVLAEFGVSP